MIPLMNNLNLGDINVLPQKEIRKLIAKAQDGDTKAQNRVVQHNCGLIPRYAKLYTINPTMLTFEDLFQEGVIGLINAVRTFKPVKKIAFSTWAVIHIKQRVNRYITMNQRLIHIPVHVTEKMRKIWKKQTKNLQLTVKEQRIAALYDNSSSVSLDYPINEGTFHDMLTAPIGDSLDLIKHDLETLIRKVKANPRDKEIMRQRATGDILAKIGKKHGITRERTRQVESKFTKKIKRLIKGEL